ncbi:MAG: hypothetical protein J6N56_04860 [Bacteroidales bacterium]|nr:hypothetical protein [Bacteroidales bacterium]
MLNYILGIFLLLVLWGFVSSIVEKIKNSREDRAIKKAHIKEVIENKTQDIIKKIDPQIKRSRESFFAFREMANKRLPDLEYHMINNMRQKKYERFVITNKKLNTKVKR